MFELIDKTYPLVSIGLPTYNRVDTLRRAITSALNQSYKNIELVISDNTSTDGTEALCREFAATDTRVNYVRQIKNLGPTPNFVTVLNFSKGDFFLWLCDDDWLDPFFVEKCIDLLLTDPDTILAGGVAKYYVGEEYRYDGASTNLIHSDGLFRMLNYYDGIVDNGIYYGVWRRKQLMQFPMVNAMGNDWLTLAAAAYFGKIRTLQDVFIHRDLGGSTVSFDAIVEQMELPRYQARFPYITIAVFAIKDILFQIPIFVQLPLWRRLYLALLVFSFVVWKYIVRKILVDIFFGIKKLVRAH